MEDTVLRVLGEEEPGREHRSKGAEKEHQGRAQESP